MALIAVGGRKNSGKDEVGKIIQYLTFMDDFFYTGISETQEEWESEYGVKALSEKSYLDWEYQADNSNPKWQIKKFADKLEDIVCILLGCDREDLEDREYKEKELGPEWYRVYVLDKVNNKIISNLYLNVDEVSEPMKKLLTKSHKYELVEETLTPRKLMQLLGTNCGRNIIHPNIWVSALLSGYVKLCDMHKEGNRTKCLCYRESDSATLCETEKPNWIITDMRFPNEHEAVTSRGGITIRVNRKTDRVCNCGIKESEHNLRHPFVEKPLHESETALDNIEHDHTIDNNGDITELITSVYQVLKKESIITFLRDTHV